MNTEQLVRAAVGVSTPATFGMVLGLAVMLVWLALAPARPRRDVKRRLDSYLDRSDVLEDTDMSKPFGTRVIAPLFRGVLRSLGRLAPKGNVDRMEQMLVHAGEPGGLSALDFLGLRLLFAVVLAVGYFVWLGRQAPLLTALRNVLLLAFLGYFTPWVWLRSRARSRQRQILRALPDALDMLTIGVEAGLAFESALLKVGEQWSNALTKEFRRCVAEMRVGVARDDALARMADRCGVPELRSFVTVLIQSGQLGVSIAHVLHTQAADMRMRRRQQAEELARKASVKLVFPLVFLIFPAMYVVVLGPSVPTLLSFFSSLGR